MHQRIKDFVPQASWPVLQDLINKDKLLIKVKGERSTRHGDYKALPDGKHQITVNSNLNPYRFLMTLVHEIAHYEAYQDYGRNIKPHGKEWKQRFQHLMLPFLNPSVFPENVLPVLARHLRNPKASSDTDTELSLTLKRFDMPNGKHFVFEIPLGGIFELYNGKRFQRGKKRTKRYECLEIATGKLYLFNPNAEVKLIASK